MWIITNKKILQYSSHTVVVFQHYSTADDNITEMFFRYKARGRTLCRWQIAVFIHIRPYLAANRAPTSLHITDVKVADKSIFFGNAEASGDKY